MRADVYVMLVIFFFQAEDGIRDDLVTGVQTCALPISFVRIVPPHFLHRGPLIKNGATVSGAGNEVGQFERMSHINASRTMAIPPRRRRSEERRVGKECRSRWSPYH